MKTAPDGPATVEVILGALPGSKRQGASLLHLTTHGQAAHGQAAHSQATAAPAVQAYGCKWLPLADILAQARDRYLDAPGGLVITSACLTDVTLADYDESLTMATAFLAAGATAVIGTRWPVDDDTTLALSIRVHQHLKDGHDPAEALRRAQLDLLRPGPALREGLGPAFTATDDARLSHPASWACTSTTECDAAPAPSSGKPLTSCVPTDPRSTISHLPRLGHCGQAWAAGHRAPSGPPPAPQGALAVPRDRPRRPPTPRAYSAPHPPQGFMQVFPVM